MVCLSVAAQLSLWGVIAYGLYDLWRGGNGWNASVVVGGAFLVVLIGHLVCSGSETEETGHTWAVIARRGLAVLVPERPMIVGVEFLAVLLVVLETW